MAKKRKKSRRWIFISIIIIVGIIVAISWMRNQGPKPIKVSISKASNQDITQTVSAIGTIKPETEIKITSETSGEIIYLGGEEGDTVKQGQLLVRINPDIIETQLQQSKAAVNAAKMEIEARKAQVENTKNDFERISELFEKEFVSKQEYDIAKAAYDGAVANLESAKARYEQSVASLNQIERNQLRTTIYSPINGIITSLNVEVGEKAVGTELMEGTELMIVSDLTAMNAVVDVDENDIVKVKKGDTASIEIDAFPDRLFQGYVFEIGHSAEVASLGSQDQVTNFQVKIRLNESDEQMRPGMSCNVDIKTETRYNVVSVPLQAVTVRELKNVETNPDVNDTGARIEDKSNQEFGVKKRPPSVVFLLKDGKAVQKRVQTGISDRGFIEITEGLKSGDKIISGNFQVVNKLLFDGAIVEIDSSNANKRRFGRK